MPITGSKAGTHRHESQAAASAETESAYANAAQAAIGALTAADPSAATASNPTVPPILTAGALVPTWSANDPAITNGTYTVADGNTVGDDNDAGDALSAHEDQIDKLVTDAAASRVKILTYETAISANIVDIAGNRTEISAVVADLATIKTLVNPIRSDLVAQGFIKGEA